MLSRGKNDKIDAARIAQYGHLKREMLEVTKMPSRHIMQLKELINTRERMVKHRSAYQTHLKGLERFYKPELYPLLYRSEEKIIQELNQTIKQIEKDIMKLVEEEPTIKEHYKLATSLKGVALVLGVTLLAYSEDFTKFKSWRQFTSYAGIAPFEYQSGSSIKGRRKVSNIANKRIKALLSNAALSGIRHSPALRLYYENKIKEGKHKMLVQNIIRNKVLSRVFAAVRRGTPYVETLGYAA